MEEIMELVEQLEATFKESEKWAGGTYARQERQQGRRVFVREFDLLAACEAMSAILSGLERGTVSQADKNAAQRVIQAAKWHEVKPPARQQGGGR